MAPWGPSGVTPSVSVILSPNLPSCPSGRESPHSHRRARPRGARPVLFPLLGPKAGPRTEELVSQESRRSREKQWAVPGIPSPRRSKGNAGLNSRVGKDVCFRQSLIQQLRELHQEQVYWALVVTQRDSLSEEGQGFQRPSSHPAGRPYKWAEEWEEGRPVWVTWGPWSRGWLKWALLPPKTAGRGLKSLTGDKPSPRPQADLPELSTDEAGHPQLEEGHLWGPAEAFTPRQTSRGAGVPAPMAVQPG